MRSTQEYSITPCWSGRWLTGSAGGVYGSLRTVSLNIQKNGGKVREGGDQTNGADGKWSDFEKH